MIWITLGIIITSIAGIFLSQHIEKHRSDENHSICPIGSNCEPLLNGRFSHFFGVSVEKLGKWYFAFILALYAASLIIPLPLWILFIGLSASGIAFVFSLYLSIVQVFVVRRWCTLALFSSALSFLILVLAFLGYEKTFIEFTYSHRDLFRWIFVLAVWGGTLITTFHAGTFIKFLKDFRISKREERRLTMFSQVAWVALGFAFFAGLGLVLTDQWREIVDSTSFIVMIFVMGMLIVYEVIANMIVAPWLINLNFEEGLSEEELTRHAFYRKTAFSFIGVGVVSWYSLLLLTTFDWFSYSSSKIFLIYVGLIIASVICALYLELIISKKSQLFQKKDSN